MTKKKQKIIISSQWKIEHWRKDQKLSEQEVENLCPDEVINDILDVYFSGASATATWYIALFSDDHTPAGGDTYATPGYTEATSYDESTRQVWSEDGVSGKSISNSGSKAEFTMNGNDSSIYGASLVSDNTKGDTAATAGILGPVVLFPSAVTSIADDDVIKVQVTVTGADDA